MDNETVKFDKPKIIDVGGSTYVLVPKPVLEYLELKIGDGVIMTPQKGKHGKYAAFWKKDQTREE